MTSHPERYIGFGLLVLIGSMVISPALDWWKLVTLPSAVLKTVEKQFPGGEISRIKTSVWRGRGTVYDIHVRHNGNRCFVCVMRNGQVLYISRNVQDADRSLAYVSRSAPDAHGDGSGLCRLPRR